MDEETFTGEAQPRLVCEAARVIELDEATRRVRHVISTSRLDRGNRIVEVGGWRLANYRKNPIVLADHDYAIERIIGRGVDTKVEGDALVSTTEFHSEGLGNVAFRLVQAGLGRTWSVGWQGLKGHRFEAGEDCPRCQEALKTAKWGYHFQQQELLEYSLVAVPANPDAVMGLRAAGLVQPAELDEWVAMHEAAAKAAAAQPNHTLVVNAIDAVADDDAISNTEGDARPIRSAAFYEALFTATRNNARRVSALRVAQRIGV